MTEDFIKWGIVISALILGICGGLFLWLRNKSSGV